MRLDTLSYSAMRWLVAAAAASAFVVALSVQTVRGASISAPAVAAGVETAIASDSTPGTAPRGGGKLVAVGVPALRAPKPRPHKGRHHRVAPAAPAPVTALVATPAATPTPVPAVAPVSAPPAAPVVRTPLAAPVHAAPKPKAPARGQGFDSSG